MTNLQMRPSIRARGAMDSQKVAQRVGYVRAREMCVRLSTAIIIGLSLTASPAYASGKLVLFPDPPILIALMVGFVVLIAPLNAMIFRPLLRVLDEREAKIAGATTEASHLVDQAVELTEQYRSAIREAREEAEVARKTQLESARTEHASITGEARAESEGEIGRAREDIEGALVEARQTIEAAARDLAKVAAERILGRPL